MSAPRVLIVGLGGLGCPASLALAQAGVRRFTFLDPDLVEPSNLPRQLWHPPAAVGWPKVDSARAGLLAAFPDAEIEARQERLDAGNAASRIEGHSLVIDGTDGIASKYLLNDAALLAGVPLVYGGVLRFSGQAMAILPGGPCLRCLYETPPDPDAVPTCASAGVLGPVAGMVGALQARLGLRALEGGGGGALFLVDGVGVSVRRVRLTRRPECAGCGEGARSERLMPPEVLCRR